MKKILFTLVMMLLFLVSVVGCSQSQAFTGNKVIDNVLAKNEKSVNSLDSFTFQYDLSINDISLNGIGTIIFSGDEIPISYSQTYMGRTSSNGTTISGGGGQLFYSATDGEYFYYASNGNGAKTKLTPAAIEQIKNEQDYTIEELIPTALLNNLGTIVVVEDDHDQLTVQQIIANDELSEFRKILTAGSFDGLEIGDYYEITYKLDKQTGLVIEQTIQGQSNSTNQYSGTVHFSDYNSIDDLSKYEEVLMHLRELREVHF